MPDGCKNHICVSYVSAPILRIYSSEHGDNPRYPNLEKIPRIPGSGLLVVFMEGAPQAFFRPLWSKMENP